jgi:hypothetical protein
MIRLVIASLIFLCLFSCNNQPTLEKQYVKMINSQTIATKYIGSFISVAWAIYDFSTYMANKG